MQVDPLLPIDEDDKPSRLRLFVYSPPLSYVFASEHSLAPKPYVLSILHGTDFNSMKPNETFFLSTGAIPPLFAVYQHHQFDFSRHSFAERAQTDVFFHVMCICDTSKG